MSANLHYQSGFGNVFETEALTGALPRGRNSPQACAYGLYAEQISGTAFTAPRAHNLHSWVYRIQPAAVHSAFEPYAPTGGTGIPEPFVSYFDNSHASPNQLRWNPFDIPDSPTTFLQGVRTLAGNADPLGQTGCAAHIYVANRSMGAQHFYNADAEMLLIPQLGRLRLLTEMGTLDIEPQEIAVIPRGIRFRVTLCDDQARGYLCENYGAPLQLPDLGPIGSNGLANPRDFLTPVAAYEDVQAPHELVAKFQGRLWTAKMDHSPLNVVAWHGNYAPYKYDLRRFNAMGSITYDHPDPSIFLVLHSPSDTPGTSNLDFVVFPPRILVAQDTFRPPWFHRNIASEFMGLIHGQYDAKADGFAPGGASLHNSMSGHGPDAATFDKASRADTSKPDVIQNTMAFMLETRRVWLPTAYAMRCAERQHDYTNCWQGLTRRFDAEKP